MKTHDVTTLAIETATTVCSVAVTRNGVLSGEIILADSRQHSEKLLPLVHTLLEQTGTDLREVGLIAVSRGPGAFTGLRVGLSTAQGLIFSLGVPGAGISTLHVIAEQASAHTGYICPMIDARKQQVYTCLYHSTGEGDIKKVKQETVTAPESWIKTLDTPVLLLGNGVDAYSSIIDSCTHARHVRASAYMGVPRAATVARLAEKLTTESGETACTAVEPLYIRRPDAEPKGGGHKTV